MEVVSGTPSSLAIGRTTCLAYGTYKKLGMRTKEYFEINGKNAVALQDTEIEHYCKSSTKLFVIIVLSFYHSKI